MPDLVAMARQHLELARAGENGRSAELLVHDGVLRQTVIALVRGGRLGEHNSPHAASLHVLQGRVEVTGQPATVVEEGCLVELVHARHSVSALEDSVFLLTTVTGLEDEQISRL
ncbi:cupin [Actinotalea ferrariae CF5-4]|uniref:Cupin n=1 Tax=Actinotalea ferrariae CF5-4 TaxID=948458 RepID=A0A021VVD0_9CELL|nr:cupin [Actinotalea ferrariae]EYR63995.1 cupin [Actinotalea ferrariae CF5-4]